MNNTELQLVLLTGVIVMTFAISIQMKWYQVARWKSIIISVMLVVTGLLGSKIWYYVENGNFRGRSFYGVVFIAPLVFFLVSKVIRVPYGYTLDFCAPAGCLTLSMVKIQCLRDGCCGGKALYVDENYDYVIFPSQIVEMVAFLLIAVMLFCISRNQKQRNKIFPWFLFLYGGSRFFLNFFRGEYEAYALGLTAGSFWSLIAVILGLTAFVAMGIQRKHISRKIHE